MIEIYFYNFIHDSTGCIFFTRMKHDVALTKCSHSPTYFEPLRSMIINFYYLLLVYISDYFINLLYCSRYT